VLLLFMSYLFVCVRAWTAARAERVERRARRSF
jgi:hypothetical protein